MKRRDFFKRLGIGTAAIIAMPVLLSKEEKPVKGVKVTGIIEGKDLVFYASRGDIRKSLTKQSPEWEKHLKNLPEYTASFNGFM
ncbi:hypothetical protein KAR91_46280 [Candidatus Pacearchaeota archaeon]|nr:hypothetical protein [Candidatus Pacearchaeota archaeon]